MDFQVRTFLNETRGDRFEAFRPESSVLVEGPAFTLTLDEGVQPSVVFGTTRKSPDGLNAEALDLAWAVGNRMRETILVWPSTVRSLSVGDVIVLEGRGQWAVAPMGFEGLEVADVAAAAARQAVR